MDTKSKNKWNPTVAWGLLLLFIMTAVLSAWDVNGHQAFLDKTHYFRSAAFANQLNTQWNLIRYYYLDNKNYPLLPPEEKMKAGRISWLTEEYSRQKKEREAEIRQAYA